MQSCADCTMNLMYSSTWNLCEVPSVQTLRHTNHAEYPRMILAAPVNAFVLKVPMPIDSNHFVDLPFEGGTLQDLLQRIYRYYQEPVDLDEINICKDRAVGQRELVRLDEHEQELVAGCHVKRIDILDCQDARFGSIENDYLIVWLD